MRIKAVSGRSLRALFAALLIIIYLPGKPCGSATLNMADSEAGQDRWPRLAVGKQNNFTVEIPARPKTELRSGTILIAGEPFSEARISTVYHNGVVYIIRLYKSSSARKLFSKYHKTLRLKDVDESEVTVGGIKGRHYVKKGDDHYFFLRLFHVKDYLYVFEAAARDESNPDIRRFFSSITPGDPREARNDTGSAGMEPASDFDVSESKASSTDEPLSEDEVTRPAVAVYKSWPRYLIGAKIERVSGTVKVRVVYNVSGELTDVELIKGLKGGLTEEVLRIIPLIRFLPAEKDGRLVSQYAELDFNFLLK